MVENDAVSKNLTEEQIDAYVKVMVASLEKKLAQDIEVLHVQRLTTVADYFIVCTGNSAPHIRTLADAVEFDMKEQHGVRPLRTEGYDSASWVLVDYGFAIVHVFHREARQFYSLERLWADVKPEKTAAQDAPSSEGEDK